MEQTKHLLTARRQVDDEELSEAFTETDWRDIRALLGETSLSGWNRLSLSPKTLREVGIKAREAGSRITRFDLELVAWAFSTEGLRDLFKTEISTDETLTPLGETIRSWVTAETPAVARAVAATVFSEAWSTARVLYGLHELKDYFEKLPALEAVASSVHYEIDKKFYRDHLSHNIRAALLGARFARSMHPSTSTDVAAHRIAFFAGLFHDIAFPISSFPETASKLASVIGSIQAIPTSFRSQGLLESKFLQLSLHYVALWSGPELVDTC